MKRSARLVLKREALAELGSGDLRNVAGGAGADAEGTHGVTCDPTGITLCGICDIKIAIGTRECPSNTCA